MSQSLALTQTGLAEAFARADLGAVFTATLTPLEGVGNIQVHYDWLYSACNCNGSEGDSFTWTVNKLNDTQVSLSPSATYRGMTLYASVRPDWSYFTQMQAPNSADWITAVGGDETIGLQSLDLNVGVFTGVNGQHLAVDSSPTTSINAFGDTKTGYRIQSTSTSVDNRTKWYMGINALAQSHLDVPLTADLSADDLEAVLRRHGRPAEEADIENWKRWTGVR